MSSNQPNFIELKVPESFRHSIFFPELTIKVDPQKELFHQVPFVFFLKEKIECREEYYIELLFNWWKDEKQLLSLLFRERKRTNSETLMIVAIGHYISILYLLNHCHLNSLQALENEIRHFSLKPLNAMERISFILEKPHLFSAYIQLNELFLETEKLFRIRQLKRK